MGQQPGVHVQGQCQTSSEEAATQDHGGVEERVDGRAADVGPVPLPPLGSSPMVLGSLTVWVRPLAWAIVLVLALRFIEPLSTVVLGVLAACIIACTLEPLTRYMPLPRGLSVAVLGLGLVAVVALVVLSLSWPLAGPISRAAENWPQTKKEVDATLLAVSQHLGFHPELSVERLLGGLGDFLVGQGAGQLFSRSADLVLGVLISLVFALVGSIFLLSEPPERLIHPALRVLTPRHRPTMEAALSDLAPRLRRWVIGTMTGMCVVFTASAIGYTSIGLKMAVPLALLAGFAEIVPTVGPAVACVIAALFAAATQSGAKAAGVLAVYGIIQALEAYLILPLIMRGAVNIHPAVTLFTVVLWGKIFGVPGLMLAIPINLTIWTMLEHFRMRQTPELVVAPRAGGDG